MSCETRGLFCLDRMSQRCVPGNLWDGEMEQTTCFRKGEIWRKTHVLFRGTQLIMARDVGAESCRIRGKGDDAIDEKEQKRVNRRKFLGDSSKTALAGTAAAFLGLGLMPTKAQAKIAGCWPFQCMLGCGYSCKGFCSGACSGGCSGTCNGCSGDCSGTCAGGCTRFCNSACELAGFSARAGARCGTPVLTQEIANRQFVA